MNNHVTGARAPASRSPGGSRRAKQAVFSRRSHAANGWLTGDAGSDAAVEAGVGGLGLKVPEAYPALISAA